MFFAGKFRIRWAEKAKKFVEVGQGMLSSFFLPPYSPELNPDEWVGKSVKQAESPVPRPVALKNSRP
ncbi:hypothetical protein ACQPYK_48620 (plasmid) [Streptosporangium sp. CA-135522]|uniref:hypothetical protein n=1 Tax=Streptosporangium sp. CA-135522 TaxID=3240072 RepID=UPI003D92A49D